MDGRGHEPSNDMGDLESPVDGGWVMHESSNGRKVMSHALIRGVMGRPIIGGYHKSSMIGGVMSRPVLGEDLDSSNNRRAS